MNQRMRDLRKSNGWTQSETAKKVGISIAQYQLIELGKSKGSAKAWKRIAEVFETSVEYLQFGGPQMKELMERLQNLNEPQQEVILNLLRGLEKSFKQN